jgi:tetratricopeptide (TPR) repeat protein
MKQSINLAATFLTAWMALAQISHAADRPMTREQASRALTSPDPAARRAAAAALAETGRMSDVASLVNGLRDRDEEMRAIAEASIWTIWGRSGDAEVDAMYQKGVQMMNVGAAGEAIKIFSLIIEKKPDFAEGWNKRATLYYSVGEYQKSLHDCDEVMKRNPHHFGALAGYGMIYVQLDQPGRALEYFKRALKINPNMHGVAESIELLEQQGKPKRGNYI